MNSQVECTGTKRSVTAIKEALMDTCNSCIHTEMEGKEVDELQPAACMLHRATYGER